MLSGLMLAWSAKMTNKEAAIVSAYTGLFIGDFEIYNR